MVISADYVPLKEVFIKLLFSLKTVLNYSAKIVQGATDCPNLSQFSSLADSFPFASYG